MKINKIILPVVASAMLLTGCDDQIMEWGLQDGHTAVTSADLPLAVKEVLANYDDIKTYSAANHPNMKLGLGIGAAIYQGEDGRHELAKDNFQMVTWGNAMKMDAIVSASGALNFTNLDPALKQLKDDGIDLYGHNFFWHTQQQQNYLRSLIAPEITIETDGDIASVLKNGSFDNGIENWNGWGNSSTREWDETGGIDGSGAAKLTNPSDAATSYSAQFVQNLSEPLTEGTEYILRFKARCSIASGSLEGVVQNSSTYKQVGTGSQAVGTSWTTIEKVFTATADEYNQLCINFGKVGATYWIDNVELGTKVTGPTNYCDNGSFEDGTEGWTINNAGAGIEAVEAADAVDGKFVLKATASESSSNYWDCQVTTPTIPTFPGEKVRISFFIKSDQMGQARVSYASSSEISNQWPWVNWTGSQSNWTESFETSTGWLEVNYIMQNYSHDFVDGATTWRFCIDLGKLPGVTYYIDHVRVTKVSEEDDAAAARRATKMIYTFKTAEEKNEALTNAMEAWVKGMAEHLAEKGIVPVAYDVINEAIADGSNGVRGLNGVFGGSITDDDGNVTYDSAPVETEEDGLTLNWGSGHWYWGYYVPDYAVKAFQFARQYLPASTKLFYNDYNLESSDSKRAAAIQFVKDIDAANGSDIVDGIGTQMHVSFSPTDDADENAEKLAELKAKVDKQFQELAATGKLIRVTELDISVNTGSPSAAQYKAQADAYQLIFESYFENVPEEQQSGITIWSLTDAEDEHEYWLKGQVPNLWDASFKRKWAYKGVCDALAGEDIGLTFGSDSYKAYYEKNNVSDTVK